MSGDDFSNIIRLMKMKKLEANLFRMGPCDSDCSGHDFDKF